MGERRKAGGRNPERDNGKGARRAHTGDWEPIGFGAVRVDGGNGESVEFIKPEEILYAFTAGAVAVAAVDRKKLAIMAKWTTKLCFPSGAVFLRTRTGIYRSYLRTLEEFKRTVSARRFRSVSRSVVANLGAVSSINLGGQPIKTLSYAVDGSEFSWMVEFVTVSRKYLREIREFFVMPKRFPAHI
jgi:hypothetical protein